MRKKNGPQMGRQISLFLPVHDQRWLAPPTSRGSTPPSGDREGAEFTLCGPPPRRAAYRCRQQRGVCAKGPHRRPPPPTTPHRSARPQAAQGLTQAEGTPPTHRGRRPRRQPAQQRRRDATPAPKVHPALTAASSAFTRTRARRPRPPPAPARTLSGSAAAPGAPAPCVSAAARKREAAHGRPRPAPGTSTSQLSPPHSAPSHRTSRVTYRSLDAS